MEKRKMNKLISVIMPNYNTPIEYLKEAIDSILKQTYSYFELIIIDDASTDESLAYIERLRDNRIVIIKNQHNIGPAKSRNKGLQIAKGDYIAIMDSDDISNVNRFEKQIQYMEQNEDVIVCGAWFEKFGIECKVRKPVIDNFEEYRCQLLFSNTPITLCHSTAMLRKSLLDKYGIKYDETLPKAQDYGMWTVCSKYGRMAILEEVLLKYRTHEKQISTEKYDEQKEFANLISRRQLEKMGIMYIPEAASWRTADVKSVKEFVFFVEWLEEIIYKNSLSKIYEEIYLEKYINKLLWRAIKNLGRRNIIYIGLRGNKRVRKLIMKQCVERMWSRNR